MNWYKKVSLEFETRSQSTPILQNLFENGAAKKEKMTLAL
jgi:hypothetical protein